MRSGFGDGGIHFSCSDKSQEQNKIGLIRSWGGGGGARWVYRAHGLPPKHSIHCSTKQYITLPYSISREGDNYFAGGRYLFRGRDLLFRGREIIIAREGDTNFSGGTYYFAGGG